METGEKKKRSFFFGLLDFGVCRMLGSRMSTPWILKDSGSYEFKVLIPFVKIRNWSVLQQEQKQSRKNIDLFSFDRSTFYIRVTVCLYFKYDYNSYNKKIIFLIKQPII